MLSTIMFTMMSISLVMMIHKSWEIMTMLPLLMVIVVSMYYPMVDSVYLVSYSFMLDSMSMLMMMLSMWVASLMMLSSYLLKSKKMNYHLFIATLLLLLLVLMLCFIANNTVMFYIMFETSLIPTMFLIMMWGNQPERKTASLYITMYTVAASLPMLIIILKMSSTNMHNMFMLKNYMLPLLMNTILSWLMLMMAFMVKLPVFSLHLWLPKAHVEAPVAGSMMLAAILLKLGSYGLIRMNNLIQKSMSSVFYYIISLAIIGASITNMLCLRQTDLKSLIAYSSVGHMGLMISSTMTNSKLGEYASLMIMLTHALTSSCMFFLTNMTYEKMNTRNIILMNSTLISAPSLSLMWIMVIIANMAMPPMLNIIGEVMAMMSTFIMSKTMMVMMMSTSLSTTGYSLYLYTMVNHGNQLKVTNPNTEYSSVNFITFTSHMWPLLIFMVIPSKLMMWS